MQNNDKDDMAAHRAWLVKAETVAHKPPEQGGSPHPTVKVGAVLVDAQGREIAEGANRFADGLDWRKPERYEDGSRSLWFNCAEQMVIAQALKQKVDLKGARLYVTLEPCAVCAGLIAECGIHEVYTPKGAINAYDKLKPKWRLSTEIGYGKLIEAGVNVTRVDMD